VLATHTAVVQRFYDYSTTILPVLMVSLLCRAVVLQTALSVLYSVFVRTPPCEELMLLVPLSEIEMSSEVITEGDLASQSDSVPEEVSSNSQLDLQEELISGDGTVSPSVTTGNTDGVFVTKKTQAIRER